MNTSPFSLRTLTDDAADNWKVPAPDLSEVDAAFDRSALRAEQRFADVARKVIRQLARSGMTDAIADQSGSSLGTALAGAFRRVDAYDARRRRDASLVRPGAAGAFGPTAGGESPPLDRLFGSTLAARSLNPTRVALDGIGTSARSAATAIGAIPTAISGLAATLYSIRSIGSALETFVVRPLVGAGRILLTADEDARRFAYSMSSALGSVGRARELDAQLVSLGRRNPATVESLRESALTLAYTPALAGRVGFARDAEQAASATAQLARLQQQMAAIDPAQGTRGSQIAIRELTEGGGNDAFRSISRRYGISGKSLARSISRELNLSVADALEQVKADPSLATRSLGLYLDALVPDQTSERMGRLLSVRWEKVQDAVKATLNRVSEGGFFDAVSERLRKVSDGILDLWADPKFADQAQRIGDALGRILTNVADAFVRFVARLSGTDSPVNTITDFVSVLTVGIEKLADLSARLPQFAGMAGDFLHNVGQYIKDTLQAIQDIAESLKGLRSAGLRDLLFGSAPARPAIPAPVAAVAGLVRAIPEMAAPTPAATSRVPATVRRLIDAEDTGPAWSTRQAALGTMLGRVEVKADQDELARVMRSGAGIWSATLNGDPKQPLRLDGLFKAMRDDQVRSLAKFTEAIDQGRSELSRGGPDAKLSEMLGRLEQTRAGLGPRFDEAAKSAADLIADTARDFNSAMAASLENLPGWAEAPMRERLAAGRSSFADRAAKLLADAGFPVADQSREFGLAGQSIERRQRETSAIVNANLDGVEGAGRYGRLSIGMSGEDVRAARLGRLGDRAVAASQLDYLNREGIGRQTAVLDAARGALAADPGSEQAARNVAVATQEMARLMELADQLGLKLDDVRAGFVKFGSEVRDALDSSVGDAISGLITGTADLRDVLVGFAQDVVRAFSDMAARNLIQSLIGDAGKTQTNGSTAGLGGLLGAIINGLAGSSVGGGASTQAMADGGVFAGGLRMFAAGGVVNAGNPVIGVVGEGLMNEAIVPMPDGRNIPIVFHDDGAFAVLPGGRKIPARVDDRRARSLHASMFAAGGIAPGGLGIGGALGSFANSADVQGSPAADGYRPYVRPESSAGGGDVSMQVFIVDSPESAVAKGFRSSSNRQMLIDLVAKDVLKGGKVSRSLSRPRR